MRSFAIIAVSLASLCAAAALPVLDLPIFPPVQGVTSEVGDLSERQVPAGVVGEVSKVIRDVQARDEPSCDIPDLFDEINSEIAVYITELNSYDDSCDVDEVNGVLTDLKADLDARLSLLQGLEGKSQDVVFTTASGTVLLITDVAAKITLPLNDILAAAHHLLTLKVVAEIEVDLTAAVEAMVDLVEEVVVVDAELVSYINAGVIDTFQVVAQLGIAVEGGLCL